MLTNFLYDYLIKNRLDKIVVIDESGRIIAVRSKQKAGNLDQVLVKGNNIYETTALPSIKKHLKNKDSGTFSFTVNNNTTKYHAGFATEKEIWMENNINE